VSIPHKANASALPAEANREGDTREPDPFQPECSVNKVFVSGAISKPKVGRSEQRRGASKKKMASPGRFLGSARNDVPGVWGFEIALKPKESNFTEY
jgi:hypothetical protein